MTEDKIALRALLEKGSDATFLREMIGFAAERLMQLGDAGGNGRASDTQAPARELFPSLPGASPHGGEGSDRGRSGGIHPGHLHTVSG
jgi:hypothetical protein